MAIPPAPLAGGDTDCPAGGILLETGIDENGNGVLDPGEIDKTEKICNGTPGADGAAGADGVPGAPGESGLNSLVSLVKEFVGENCPAGGIKINSGLDANNNDILDAAEITQTEFVCNGGDPPFTYMKNKLLAFDVEAGDNFGSSVDISGDYAIVGAEREGLSINGTGAAYLYRRTGPNTWGIGIKVIALDAEDGDNFGGSVAISRDYAIVGAGRKKVGVFELGAAYIYRRTSLNTWDDGIKIIAPDADLGDRFFGGSVAISGDYAIVGTSGENEGGSFAGAAYIYRRTGPNTWDSGTKLTAFDAAAFTFFGTSVDISGDVAIVGASGQGFGEMPSSAYIYHRTDLNAWDNGTKITPPDIINGDHFGTSVAIFGNVAIVGADDEDAENSGAAYIYQRTGPSTWDAGTKITAPDAEIDDFFGTSVDISRDVAIVGATGEDAGGKSAGAAYIYHKTGPKTWDKGTKITDPTGEAFGRVGGSVAISGDIVIVGARDEDADGLSNAGAAYIFK